MKTDISIHTPAKGVTCGSGCKSGWLSISIHTPAKGVTKQRQQLLSAGVDFNPHSREGSDPYNNDGLTDNVPFQSTLPRRE